MFGAVNQSTMIRWGRALLFAGFGIVVLGVLLWWLQVTLGFKHNLNSASVMGEFTLLGWAYLTAYIVGALLAVVGAVVTCFGSGSKQLVQAGAFFLLGSFIMITVARQIFFRTGEEVWTRGIVFTSIVAFIVGLIFLSVGLARRLVWQRR
jgi:hypothetical protein